MKFYKSTYITFALLGEHLCSAATNMTIGVVWGRDIMGGDASSIDLTNVADISCGKEACALRRTDGTASVWGNADGGGDASSIDLTNVADISCGGSACSARITIETTPSPTRTPSSDPTVPPSESSMPPSGDRTTPSECSLDEILFTISLQTDSYGVDTTWKLEMNTRGRYWDLVSRNAMSYEDNSVYQSALCIPKGECFRFIISDEAEDGLCCNYSKGHYSVFLGSQMVKYSIYANTAPDEITQFGTDGKIC